MRRFYLSAMKRDRANGLSEQKDEHGASIDLRVT